MNNLKYRRIYVPQLDEKDCGVACLSMILKFNNSQVSLSHLRQLAKTNLEGTSALGLINAANHYGLKATAIKADPSIFDSNQINFPFIAHLIKHNSLLHYCVVLKKAKQYLIIADPDPNAGISKVKIDHFLQEWTGIALLFKPSTTFKPVHEDLPSLWNLLPYILKHKRLIIYICITTFAMLGISLASSYFFRFLLDTYLPHHSFGKIQIMSIGLLVAYFFEALFLCMQSILITILGQKLSNTINLKYLSHIIRLPISFFSTRKIGEITSRFDDSEKITDALTSSVLTLIIDLSSILVLGVFLAFECFPLFTITFLLMFPFGLTIIAFSSLFQRLYNSQMENNAILTSSIIENLRGIETIKSFSSEHTILQKFSQQYHNLQNSSISYACAESIQASIKQFLQLSSNVIILWLGSKLVIQGQLTIGQLISYNALLGYFFSPLENLFSLQPILQSANIAQLRLQEILSTKTEDENDTKKIQETRQDPIKLMNVNFSYGYYAKTLNNITLTISPNEKIAIVGTSGSGKSTLAKLLVNFYQPTAGKIVIGSTNIDDISKRSLRKLINYIPQTPYIFSGSIRDNLTFGVNKSVTSEEIAQACQKAEILSDIDQLPFKFDTKLDENATTLSGGQKQRLSIARALLSSAPILIFDETTSSLDTITEKKVLTHLLNLRDKTIIFISHHFVISEQAEKVVVLKHGKIIEQGSHTQLIDQKGYYFQLVNKQLTESV